MKLEGLLLERAVALGDKSTILQIFAEHFPEMRSNGYLLDERWKIIESGFVPSYSIVLETPFGSFHYSRGKFYAGYHTGAYVIIHTRGFDRYAIL